MKVSLEALGTCAHRGVILPGAITRAVVWPHRENTRLAFVWDPTITLVNQRICGDRYRALTRKLFAGEFEMPTPESQRRAPEAAPLPPITGWRLIDNTQRKAA